MGYAGFKLLFTIIILLQLLTIIIERPAVKGLSSGLGSLLNRCLGFKFKLSWVTILDYWDTIAIISAAYCLSCFFFWELGNYTVSFLRALLCILTVPAISEAAATVLAINKANTLCVING